jgi:hypothetical protein
MYMPSRPVLLACDTMRTAPPELHDREPAISLSLLLYSLTPVPQLAASPVPHMFQPGFIESRSRLLAWLRAAHSQGLLEGTPVGELVAKWVTWLRCISLISEQILCRLAKGRALAWVFCNC